MTVANENGIIVTGRKKASHNGQQAALCAIIPLEGGNMATDV